MNASKFTLAHLPACTDYKGNKYPETWEIRERITFRGHITSQILVSFDNEAAARKVLEELRYDWAGCCIAAEVAAERSFGC